MKDILDIKEIGDTLAGLSGKQSADLTGYLKETYKIEAAVGSRVVVSPVDPDPVAPPAPTSFNVVLKSAGDKKIQVIKVVRSLTGLGLKEAKDLVDGAPKVLKESLSREEAEKIKKELEAQGAMVELQ